MHEIDYRYPTELLTLAVTVIVTGALIAVFAPFTLGAILLLFLFGVGLNYLLVRVRIAFVRRSAILVSESQFPEIYRLAEECRRRLRIAEQVEVFVSQSASLNAYATGLEGTHSIVLYSALVDALDPDELQNAIGHEMGHIKFGHTALNLIIGQLGSQTYGAPLLGAVLRYAFLFWRRTAEYSADRAGLVAGGSLRKAISTQVKLSVGPNLAGGVDLGEVVRQARVSEVGLLAMLGEMASTHPLMTARIKQLVDFAFSQTFHRLRPDIKAIDL